MEILPSQLPSMEITIISVDAVGNTHFWVFPCASRWKHADGNTFALWHCLEYFRWQRNVGPTLVFPTKRVWSPPEYFQGQRTRGPPVYFQRQRLWDPLEYFHRKRTWDPPEYFHRKRTDARWVFPWLADMTISMGGWFTLFHGYTHANNKPKQLHFSTFLTFQPSHWTRLSYIDIIHK